MRLNYNFREFIKTLLYVKIIDEKGKQGKGGCGVGSKTSSSGCRRKCYEYPCCPNNCRHGGSWGKDCPPNSPGASGTPGISGKKPSTIAPTEIIDKRIVLDIPYILQDMLLKYAVGLQVQLISIDFET